MTTPNDTPETDSEFQTPAPVAPVAPKKAQTKPKAPRKTAEPEDSAKVTPAPSTMHGEQLDTASEDPMERLVCITLHDSKEVPPGGQFVGVNGKQFRIRPGVQVVVPRYVCAALDNATHGVPELDEKMRVIGIRQAPRLTYTVHQDWDGKTE